MKELKSRVYIIATLLLSALILSPSLHFGFGIDQGVFGYMAWLLLDGQWPYMASWDVNFPGIVFIHALVIFLGGPSMLAFRIFDILIQLCNVTMIHTLTRRYAGPPAGLVAGIIYALLYISSDFWHTGQRDGYTITCLLLATMTYLRFSDKGRLLMLFFSGLSLGFAFLLRPNGILFLLVFIILLLFEGHRPRDILKHYATIGIAFALPVVLVILTYAFIGGLYNLYETLVLFNGKVYSQFRTPTIYSKSIVPLLSFLIFPYFLMRFLNIKDRSFWIWPGFLVATLGSILIQGHKFHTYLLPAFPSIALLSSVTLFRFAFSKEGNVIGKGRLLISGIILCLMLAKLSTPLLSPSHRCFLPSLFRISLDEAYRRPTGFRLFSLENSMEVASYLENSTSAEDRVQIWGHETLINYLSQRVASSRFHNQFPLVMRKEEGAELFDFQKRWRLEFMEDMNRKPPRYFLVRHNDGDWYLPGFQSSAQLLSTDFPELKNWLDRNYRFEKQIGDLSLYRRVEAM